jgi:hypothetical protein
MPARGRLGRVVGPRLIEHSTNANWENFLSTFRTGEGVAQPNQYEVKIFLPRTFPSIISSSDKRDIQLRCESITLPGRNLSSTPDSNVHGPLREIVNNVSYVDSIAMTFQASSDLRERVFFEKWQYAAFNPNTWNVGYYDDYVGSVDIYLLDRQDQRKYGLKLHECFPKEIGPTELSYASNNEIVRLSITMNFRYWTTLDQNQETARPIEITEGPKHNLIGKKSNTPASVRALGGGPGGR